MYADSGIGDGSSEVEVEVAAEIFSMLADPTRIRIVLALGDTERSVNDLAAGVDRSATSVSQHLAKLRLARLVTTRQEGNRVFYSLANDHALRLVTDALEQAEHATSTTPAHHSRSTPSGGRRRRAT
jgi:DNA-binding transcriptional ArsR family regulator